MALQLVKTTPRNQLLKLVSVKDDAIDWEKTYPDLETVRARNKYAETHDLQALAFKDGCQPTLFVFDHPQRVDIAQKLRKAYSATAAGRLDGDLFTEVYQKALLGTEEGLDGAAMTTVPRRDGEITVDFLQALEDAGVFDELALAFLKIANADRGSAADQKKK